MKKRTTSALMAFVLVLCMLASSIPLLAAAPTPFKITPDKTTAHPGDTITYTVTMGAVDDLGALKFKLVFPDGLTYKSAAVTPGLKTTLNADTAEWTESTLIFLLSTDGGYTGTGTVTLMTFTATVDDGAVGDKAVTFNPEKFELIDYTNVDDIACDYSNPGSTVKVTAAPVSAAGVTIDETLAVNVGAVKTPSWTVSPAGATNKAVSFTSSNTGVASVNASTGEVTGVAEGTAVITVKTVDGGFTDTCTVTVTKVPCACTKKTEHAAQASTCTVQGWEKYYSCDDCGKLYASDGTTEITAVPYLPLADHTAVHHDAVAATHFAAGNIEYWTCSVCGKYFSDAACTTEITAAQTVIAQIPHSYSKDWKTDETSHWRECSCGSIADRGQHNFVWVTDTAATEDAAGVKHMECTVCGYKKMENTAIPKLDHTLVHHDAKAPTHDETGNIEYWTCSTCGKYFSDEAGTKEITKESVIIQKIPHQFSTDWSHDETNHWHECTCGAKADTAAHTFGGWTVTKVPTETETGMKEQVCTVCGYTEQEEIPMLKPTEFVLTIPFETIIEQTGEKAPGKESFQLEIFDMGAETEYTIINNTITTDGKGNFTGTLQLKVTGTEALYNLTEGFYVRQVKGTAEGWTYSDEVWFVAPLLGTGTQARALVLEPSITGYEIYKVVDEEVQWNDPVEMMSFTNSYKAANPVVPEEVIKPETPTTPEKPVQKTETAPKTDDTNNMAFWFALVLASGIGVFLTGSYSSKKRREEQY